MKDLFQEFTHICGILNKKLEIIPILYSSVGLKQFLGQELYPDDIDLLIPQKYLEEEWNILKEEMERDGYILRDVDEHEFLKFENRVMFAKENILLNDLFVDYENLNEIESNGIKG
jgi:hypothetical protein